jgi:hypothetical protein
MLARARELRPADLREVLGVLVDHGAAPVAGFGPPRQLRARRPTAPAALPDGSAAGPAHHRASRVRTLRRPAGAAALLGALGAAGLLVARRGAGPASPLADPSARIACPVLRASGVDPPAGWLGAAAAATACERARAILGGRPERTLAPADLLDLPRVPVDSFPDDPYGRADARERSLAAARIRVAAVLDGEVVKQASGFAVRLELDRPDGSVLARGEGVAAGLYAAVRAAMAPLVGPALIREADALDPHIAAWSGTHEVAGALHLLDLTFAIAHNAGGLAAECEEFQRTAGATLGALGRAGAWQCAYTLGRPLPSVVLDGAERSPEALATQVRLRHFITHADHPGDADRLHAMLASEPTSWGRSLIAATESCLVQASDARRAIELASFAVQAEPKTSDGQACNPWEQLISLVDGTDRADSTARAMQAWAPWNSLGWSAQSHGSRSIEQAVRVLRRAYVLSPLDTDIADTFADKLLALGEREEARAIAVALRAGGEPVHQVGSELLLLRVEASEAHFGAALERARRMLEISPQDSGWVRAQRFEAGWRALELAAILGRTSEVADQLVQRFLDPEPPVLDGSTYLIARRIPAICAAASAPNAVRCFRWFRALRGRLSAGITPETDALLAGAESYVAREFPAAARAWRPLLRGSDALAAVLPEAMVDAFEHSGDVELAERVDAAERMRAPEFNGATLGHVRAARRGSRRGDAAARELARTVVDAWSVSEDDIPAVTEMRRLVAR